MPAKLKLKFPTLKLRGSIILAAAAIFTIAIGTSLYYVVSSNRAQDLADADHVVGALAETESETVRTFLTGFAVAADSTARTAEALLANHDTSPTTYGAIVSKVWTLSQGQPVLGSRSAAMISMRRAMSREGSMRAGSVVADRDRDAVAASRPPSSLRPWRCWRR